MALLKSIAMKRRRGMISGFLAFAAFAVLSFASATEHRLFPFALLAFGVFIASIFYLMLGVRCPHCQTPIGYMFFAPTASKPVRFCAFCGASIEGTDPSKNFDK